MDEDEKADIARRGLRLIDRVEQVSPTAIGEHIAKRARDAAQEAALGGVRAVSELAGTPSKRPRVGPSAEAVEAMLARMEAESTAEFDAELRRAAQRAAEREVDIEASEAEALARLRRSFPAESKELAVLLFACVDVLEDLAEIDDPPAPETLERKERLLARIGELLAPRAEVALRSFVDHVVALSRERRAR